ncbi:cytochrome P450 [Hypoxylon sp. NC1633]|nr:cytochrome P450 [Hypoxylon sp. NC1633]
MRVSRLEIYVPKPDSSLMQEETQFRLLSVRCSSTCPATQSVTEHCLATEIRSTFTSGVDIQGVQKLSSCRYLRACIDETLRLSPPVTSTLWRELSPTDEGTWPLIIDEHTIPRETQIGVNIYTLHHNEKYFPDPSAFKPERRFFPDDAQQTERHRMHDAFATSSIGSRVCPGKAVAYLQSSLVIAKTLLYFDFENAPGITGEVGVARTTDSRNIDEFQLYNAFASIHDGPNLAFRPRGDF